MSDRLGELAEAIRAAGRAARPVRIRGGGTKDFYGQALEGEILDTRGHRGVVDYDATELYITARGGTPLREVEETLAAKEQMLPFEPPHFGEGATIGGVVAAGLAGPRRVTAGGVRDFVLGVRILDGRGQDLSFGGRVMKNVAGYDVARILAGSLGTLGLILEVTLKVLPRPAAEQTLRLELPPDRAIETVNRWAARPLPVSATCHVGSELTVRLSGATAAVRSARERIGGELVDFGEGRGFWTAVREQTHAFFDGDAALWRLSLPSTAEPLALPGHQLIEWNGSLRWLASNADARTIREAVGQARGHATLFRRGDKAVGVFHPLAPAVARINRELKSTFDPHGILNPGRMYGSED